MPPLAIAYLTLTWATEKYVSHVEIMEAGIWAWNADWCGIRNEYYNSKQGRAQDPVASDEATQGGAVRG